MSTRFIASHGTGERYLDPLDMTWCMSNSSLFDGKKELLLFQFVLDLASLLFRYNRSLMRENIYNRTLILELNNKIKQIVFSFEKIVGLCDDLVCTGDLATKQGCIDTFEQFMNNEAFDFFDSIGKIKEIMDFIDIELKHFKKLLKDLLLLCPIFIKNGRYRNVFKEIIKDFKYQLKNR